LDDSVSMERGRFAAAEVMATAACSGELLARARRRREGGL
jgi:hypothetical protein